MDAPTFLSTLLRWYGSHGRDLPWRHTRDPYAIWLSEVILQQTRVAQGQAYWERFMQRFPTVDRLAAASEDEVLKLWQGLGYYSRARHLHAAAQQVAAMGRFPDTVATIRQLKGVGDYTAAAIAAFAYNRPAVALDGNAYRVFARLLGISTPIDSSEGKREFRMAGEHLFGLDDDASLPSATDGNASLPSATDGDATLPSTAGGGPWREANSALMDLGATICTPQAPACADCPFMDCCVACRQGLTAVLPVKQPKRKPTERRMAYVWMRCHDSVALHRRGAGDIWQGLWEPPVYDDGTLPPFDGRLTLLEQAVRHVLTHRVIVADFYVLQTAQRPPLPADYVWVPEAEATRYAVPRLVEKMLLRIAQSKTQGNS